MEKDPKLLGWLKFLCHKEHFHNLCISFPDQLSAKDQKSLMEHFTQTILIGLQSLFNLQHREFANTDILFLEKEDGAITVNDLNQLDDFLTYSSLYLPSKVVILKGPVPLSQIVSNKILKILEDPAVPVSFLLLGFSYAHFLPTVRSRFLNWRIAPSDLPKTITLENETRDFPKIIEQWTNFKHANELEQWAAQEGLDISSCLNILWKVALPTLSSAPDIDRLLSFQRWHEQSELWSNPLPERWYFLFQLIKNRLQYKIVT